MGMGLGFCCCDEDFPPGSSSSFYSSSSSPEPPVTECPCPEIPYTLPFSFTHGADPAFCDCDWAICWPLTIATQTTSLTYRSSCEWYGPCFNVLPVFLRNTNGGPGPAVYDCQGTSLGGIDYTNYLGRVKFKYSTTPTLSIVYYTNQANCDSFTSLGESGMFDNFCFRLASTTLSDDCDPFFATWEGDVSGCCAYTPASNPCNGFTTNYPFAWTDGTATVG